MDILEISALKVKTRIGIHAWEQRIEQYLVLDLRLPINCANCQGQLENTLDYDGLCQSVTKFIESQSFQLIETVAEKLAFFIKEQYALTEISLSVSKPHAIKNAGNVKVTVTR